MIRIVEWLLDLENIRIGRDAPLSLKWQSAFHAWQLACFAILAAGVLFLIYRHERTGPVRRTVLGVVRFLLIALIIAVICQPTLVLQRNRVEPAHVALLVDTSMSMAADDIYTDAAQADSVARGAGLPSPQETAGHPRIDLATRALLRDDSAALKSILVHNGLQLFSFAGQARAEAFAGGDLDKSVAPVETALGALRAEGSATDLSGALREVLERAQGRRLAAIVLVSDGQSTESTSLSDAIDLARGRQVPIYAVRIGSPVEPRDVAVGPVRALENVFLGDLVAVEAEVNARGLSQPTPVNLALVDERTGTILATQVVTLDPQAPAHSVELRAKAEQTGAARYRVEAAPLDNETNLENNVDHVDVNVLDDSQSLLFVEGYPRFEYRFLKNALLREKTIKLSVLLLEADEAFVQEGTDPIRRFPETPEELSRYDVVIFGDVDPRSGWLSLAQMNMLLDFVGNEGGGFGMIAGERAAPQRYVGTPLEKLIPVRIDPAFSGRYDANLTSGYRPVLTPEGLTSRIFRFERDPEANVERFESLPELYWAARTLGPKPGATVLADHPSMQSSTGPLPLVVTGRYGSGRLFFQATDDLWRWRRHTGELLLDTYWIQVARELLRSDRASRDRRFVIRTDRRNYPYGAPVLAEVEFADSDLLAEQGESTPLVVTDAAGATVARLDARRIGSDSNLFESAFVPPRVGAFSIRAARIVPRPGEREAVESFRVDRPDLEAEHPEANHQALQRLAEGTDGKVVELDALAEALGTIPDRSVQIPDDVTEPLWDSKLVMLLFVLMISIEWMLRKAAGML